jgi:hypothetical protein
VNTFRQIRILLLLFILLLVSVGTWLTKLRSTDWDRPLVVAVYPINGDGSAAARQYIDRLGNDDFLPIEDFFAAEAAHYGVGIAQPFDLLLAPELKDKPPSPPMDRNVLGVVWWSLKMRYWAWQIARQGPPADIQMFVLYYDPAANPRLAHSLGLQKGLVHAFASMRDAGANKVVIAHELLHTLGATDKYDLSSNLPLYPIGYAEPLRQPLLPQTTAEIMAGRIPVSQTKAVQARGLDEVIVGEATAYEIRWRE